MPTICWYRFATIAKQIGVKGWWSRHGRHPSNMIDKFLSLMFFVTPLFYITKMQLRKAEIIFFSVCVAILYILATLEKPKRELTITPFVMLLAVALTQLIVYDFSPTSANCVVNIFLGVLGINIIATYSDGLNRQMMGMIVLSGAVSILFTIGQHLGYNPVISNDHDQYGALMGNAPRLANFLALTLPLAVGYSWLAGILWLLAGIYIHQFPMFLIGFVMVLIFEYQSKNLRLRKDFLFPVIGVFLAFIVWQHAHIWQSISVRLAQWQPILEQIFQHPVFGCGLGTYPIFANNFNEVAMSSAVEFFFNFGFVAGGIILYFLIRHFKQNFRITLIQTSIIGLAVLCLIEYPFEIPKLWPIIIALAGFYLIENNNKGETQ